MFLLRWLWKNMEGARRIYILGMFCTIISQSMYIITPRITGYITDTFITGENAVSNLETRSDLLIWLLVLMVGATLVRCALVYGSTMCYEHSSQSIIYKIRAVVFKNIEDQDARFYDLYRTGDIMTRVSGDLDMVRHSIAWIIRVILECVVMFTVSIVFFFSMDWLMALCLLALTPIIMLIANLFKKAVRPKFRIKRDKLSELNTAAEENISGNRVVKAFAREEYETEKFDKLSRDFRDASKDAAFTWFKFFPFEEITAQALSVVMLVCGGLFVIFGRITFGEYISFSGLVWTMSNPMRQLGTIINDWQSFTASAQKIVEIYYGRPRIITREDAVDKPERFKGKVEFDNVSLNLGGKDILKNISFTVNSGETVAIMGETGAGKTLLTELIPRIYDVTGGAVRVDGTDVRMLKLDQLRRNIGTATQDVFLYSDTIDGNIAYGDSDCPEEQVYKSARLADADGFIRNQTDGYDTIVGERGVGLSGGQKQRISLARALNVKPAILILDDTTSALDLETEKNIQDSLKSLDFECTKIIVAQRISTTKFADKVIVMKNGTVIEQGTHEELIRRNGYYKEVYDLQK